jgi:hypothetical protein
MELRPRKEMAMTAGALGPLVSQPTITTVIATHTNIEFSIWFRNVFYDHRNSPDTLRQLERRENFRLSASQSQDRFWLPNGKWSGHNQQGKHK